VDALPLQEKSTLSQPPQAKSAVAPVGTVNIRQQRVMGLERPDYASPSSFRTMQLRLPMLANFCRAAQRAVWLSPQSGAKESFSAGAYFRQRRTR